MRLGWVSERVGEVGVCDRIGVLLTVKGNE